MARRTAADFTATHETHEGGVLVDPALYEVLCVAPRTRFLIEELQMRCVLALVNEAVRCVGDGVLRGPGDGDVGAVFGLGFPRFRGGPFRYVDTIGAADVLRRVQSYSDRFGERWRPRRRRGNWPRRAIASSPERRAIAATCHKLLLAADRLLRFVVPW